MKSIAGSIVVLGACGLLGMVAVAPNGSSGEGPTYSDGLRTYAVGVASFLLLLGLIVTFLGSRDAK